VDTEIVLLYTRGGHNADFSAYASGQTHPIIDVVGYFNRPANHGGTRSGWLGSMPMFASLLFLVNIEHLLQPFLVSHARLPSDER
jgi:hypothetical protein